MKNSIYTLLLIALLLSLAACEDDPSSVGQDLLEGQDVTKIDSLVSDISVFSESYLDSINLGSAERTLIGKKDDLIATGLLKFYFSVPDSIEAAMNAGTLNIVSSVIKLRPTYYFGDDGGEWQFTSREITSSWGSTEFNTDSLAVLTYDTPDLGSNLQFVDDTTITFDFDNEIAYKWLEISAGDTTYENYGIILIPTSSSSRVIGFPALTSTSEDSYLPQLQLIVESTGEFVDTLDATLINDAYAAQGSVPSAHDNLQFIQGGLPVRANMKFDLSALPENAIIVDALLSVYTDTLECDFGSSGTDTLLVNFLTDFEKSVVEDRDDIYSLILERDGNVFQGNVRRYVQRWLDELDNEGMQVRVSDEDKALTKIAIYNNKVSNAVLKPRIQIIYTEVK